MKNYAVNVRAIVVLSAIEEDGYDIEGWDIYDTEKREDGEELVRCDRLVQVLAENDQEAADKAEIEAPAIVVEGAVIEEVSLWVDMDIDIDPEFADTELAARGEVRLEIPAPKF
jgi:hypothetical protein